MLLSAIRLDNQRHLIYVPEEGSTAVCRGPVLEVYTIRRAVSTHLSLAWNAIVLPEVVSADETLKAGTGAGVTIILAKLDRLVHPAMAVA